MYRIMYHCDCGGPIEMHLIETHPTHLEAVADYRVTVANASPDAEYYLQKQKADGSWFTVQGRRF